METKLIFVLLISIIGLTLAFPQQSAFASSNAYLPEQISSESRIQSEISNLSPPEQIRDDANEDQEDSYLSYRKSQLNAALASSGNPHEYGETVPGVFNALNSYAAYHNYQA